jgi:hypothetical protein
MPIEEDTLALLEQGRLDALQAEEMRHARYKAEDDATAAKRAQEDDLHAEGDRVREAKVAEMNEAIKARGQTAEAQIADQNVRIAALEEALAAKEVTPIVQHETVEPIPVIVHQPDPVIPLVDDVHNKGTHTI